MSEAPQVAEAPAPLQPDKDVPADVEAPAAEPEKPAEQSAEAEEHDKEEPPDVDAELLEMRRRLAEMEADSGITKDAEADPSLSNGNGVPNADGTTGTAAPTRVPDAAPGEPARIPLSVESVADADARSIYVGNVDYAATGDQLSGHFADCGTINRVTIMCNKATGMPKGFAYIEFQEHLAAQNALILNESMFLGRALKIVPKRTNIPTVYRGGYRGRPRFSRGGRGFSRRPRRAWRGRWSPY